MTRISDHPIFSASPRSGVAMALAAASAASCLVDSKIAKVALGLFAGSVTFFSTNIVAHSRIERSGERQSVTAKDFYPVNTWHQPHDSIIVDKASEKEYRAESKKNLRLKCLGLALGTLPVHVTGIVYHLGDYIYQKFSPSNQPKQKAKELWQIALSPISTVGLQLAAMYGVIRPYDGRKLYASIERATYGHAIFAPCFQPWATYHLFSGEITENTEIDAW